MGKNDKSSDEVTQERPTSLGETLRVARQEKEISIEQLAEELCVDSRFLIAIEDDDFEVLSAPVFTKGYIRQYSQRFGLEYEDLLKEYARQVGSSDVPMVATQPIQLGDKGSLVRWVVLTILLVLLGVGGWVWYYYFDMSTFLEVSLSEDDAVAETDDAVAEIDDAVEVAEPLVAYTENINQSSFDGIDQQTDLPLALSDFSESQISGTQVNVIGEIEIEAQALAQASNEDDQLLPLSVQVVVSYDEDCWTEIIDAQGERLFYELGRAGDILTFNAQLPLSFLLGNADGVRIQIDGEFQTIPADSRIGNVARFAIPRVFSD
ncbi:MAG: hypothetical protein CMM56_09320 [Rhodospirillaceae bacterium]|nr:hypothetical protein [Rhodospirillaceae bacterium]